jgi:hypothetical protein
MDSTAPAAQVELAFLGPFSTEETYDRVQVYDGADALAPLLAT